MFILSFATNVYFYIENQNLLHNLAYKELHEAVKVQECQKLLAMKSKKIQEQMLQAYAHQNNLNGFIPRLDDDDTFDDNVGKVDGIRGMPMPKHLNLPEPGLNRAPSLVQNSDYGNEFDTHFDAESSKDPEPDFAYDFAQDPNPRIQAQAPAEPAWRAPAAPVQVIAPAAPVVQAAPQDLQEQEDRQKEREVIQKLNDFIENINKNGGAEAFANQLKDEPALEAEIEHVQNVELLIEQAEDNGNDLRADELVDQIAEEVAEIVQDPVMEDIVEEVAQEDEEIQEEFEEIKEDAEEANDPWAEAAIAEEPAEPAFDLPNDFDEPDDEEHESESDYENNENENEAFTEDENENENNVENALGFDEEPQETGGEDDLSKNLERPIGIQESQSTRAENLQTSEENILNQESQKMELTEFEPTMERQPLPQETKQEQVSWLEPQPPMEQQQPVEQQPPFSQTQPPLSNMLDPLKPVVLLNGGTSQAALGQRWDNEEDELMPNQGFGQINPYNQFGQFNQFGAQAPFGANQFGINQFGQQVPNGLQTQKEEDPDEMSPVQIKSVQSLAESGGNARDCNHLYNLGVTQNGVYMIRPSPTDTPVQAKCDFRYSGGWTIIQHRFDGSVDFNKDWAAYETGFGQAQSEYWLGLEHITKLSKSADTRIRIDVTDFQGHKAYVEHENFFVNGAEDNYRLHVGIKRHGDLGDSFQVTSGEKFTTYDRDNDGWSGNCAQDLQGGGWYSKCSYANINGKYYPTGISSKRDGIYWAKFPADYRPPDPEKPGYRLNSFFYSMKEIKISILVDPNK